MMFWVENCRVRKVVVLYLLHSRSPFHEYMHTHRHATDTNLPRPHLLISAAHQHWRYSANPSANNGPAPIRSVKEKGDKGCSAVAARAQTLHVNLALLARWRNLSDSLCRLRLWNVVVTAQSGSSLVASRLTPQFVPRNCHLPANTLAVMPTMTR
jgi:hypothetical protein